jgi:hypothetical protein
MPVMRVVQMPVDQIVDVIAVRNRGVSAPFAMLMTGLVPTAAMLFHRGTILMMEMPIVQVVYVPIVQDGGVATTLAVYMRMIGMLRHRADSY